MPSVHDQIIANSNTTNITKATQEALNGRNAKSSIGSDEFLFLLTQQLQYQDPMNPMDNTDMLAQEAQFATLEQMENLSNSFSKFSNMYQANSLLGQTVGVVIDGKEVTGKVEFADYSDTKGASISVNGTMYPLDSIVKIYPENTEIKPDKPTDKPSDKPVEKLEKTALNMAIDGIKNNAHKIPEAIMTYENSSLPKL